MTTSYFGKFEQNWAATYSTNIHIGWGAASRAVPSNTENPGSNPVMDFDSYLLLTLKKEMWRLKKKNKLGRNFEMV